MKQIKLFIPALCLSLAGSFLLTLYGPLELLFTNLEEFHFGFDMLFPLLLVLFAAAMIAAMAGFAVCRLIYARLYDLALCAAMTAFICTYFQGMFMAGNLPPLDGSPIRWYLYHRQYAQSILLWLIVGIAVSLGVRFLHMERMRIYLSAQNLLTIKSSNFTGNDPENPGFGYPIPLNLTFGLNVSF